MKRRFFSILTGLLLLPALCQAATEDEQYVDLYQIIQQGTQMLEQGKAEGAFALFRRAEMGLKQFKKDYPTWNERIVNFRLADLEAKIKPLAAKYPEPVLAPATPSKPAQPAKAAADKAPVMSASFENQLALLNDEIIRLRVDRAIMEKKLNEALAARPAAADPAELAKAEGKIKDLQKDNDVLKATLDQTRRDAAGMVSAVTAAETRKQLDAAQDELKKQTKQMASLQKENAAAAKLKDENSSLKKELTNATKAAKTADKLGTENSGLKAEVAMLKEQADKLESENKRLAKMPKSDPGSSTLKKELDEANRKLAKQASLESRVDSLDAQLKDAQMTIASLRKENEKMEKILIDPGTGSMPSKATDDSALRRQLEVAKLEAEHALAELEKSRKANETVLNKAVKERESLASENKSLEEQLKAAMSAKGKSNPKDAARIKELETERDRLAKDLKDASKELNSRQTRKQLAKVETMADELATLKSRLEVLEARPVPYTKEELALFSKPKETPQAPVATVKKVTQELPESARSLVAEAQTAFRDRRFKEAESKYKQVLEQNDSHVYTLAQLAASQIEQSDYSGADKNLKKALSIAPEDSFALTQMGFLRLRQHKNDEALNYLGKAAQKDPKDAVVQNYLGVVLSEKGQRAAAESAWRKAVQLNPGYAEAHNNLAVVYLTQKPPLVELARWHYQKAIAAGWAPNPDFEKMLNGK